MANDSFESNINKINKFSPKGVTIGFVLEANKRSKSSLIKAYVPKFMSSIDMGDNIWEKEEHYSSSIIKNVNQKFPDADILNKNYINLQSMTTTGLETQITNKGQRIEVEFIDGDLKKGRFSIYRMTEDENNYVNTRYHQFVENVVPLSSEASGQAAYDLKRNRLLSIPNPNSRRLQFVEKEFYDSNVEKVGIGNFNSKTTRSKKDIKGRNFLINSRKKQTTNATLLGNSSMTFSKPTSSEKPEVDFYDVLMDSVNEIMGLRMGTADKEGVYLGSEPIMSLIFKRKEDKFTLRNMIGTRVEAVGDELIITNDFGVIRITPDGHIEILNDGEITLSNGVSELKLVGDDILFNDTSLNEIKETLEDHEKRIKKLEGGSTT